MSYQIVDIDGATGAEGDAAPVRGVLVVGADGTGDAQNLDVRVDPFDGRRRIQIEGKVTIQSPVIPPATTSVIIDASSPLSIAVTTTTTYVIPDGMTFFLQQIEAGSEGDSTERGSVAEVFYFNGATELILARIYLNGFTVTVPFGDVSVTRNGTTMVGVGATREIRLRRRRLSGASQEVDAVVRGYIA